MDFFSTYNQQVSERAAQNVPPLPLDAAQTAEIIRLLLANDSRSKELKELLSERVSPGVDEAAKVKAEFLDSLAQSKQSCQAISPKEAITLLGTMLGGYNIAPLINALKLAPELAQVAADALKKTLLIYDAFGDIVELAKSNKYAQEILQSWAKAEWFTSRPKVPEKLTLTVFKIDGETNTDDLSPAGDAFTRSDIPLHAQAMLKSRTQNALSRIEELKKKGNPLVYVGDVVGTGSSRKSACNSLV